jgi:glycolate oxidase FAD binding subunit
MSDSILCHAGVLSAESASSLAVFRQIAAAHSLTMQGRVHAGSGLGCLQLPGSNTAAQAVLTEWRSYCETLGGFLTILEAPTALKQTLDVWGYSGNALGAMRKLKEHFDPNGLLNPGRFVGGI